jgi:all-trans-retinol 13,14-reductase
MSCTDYTYDVIIIGSGIAGLTAAAILARKGKKVIIVEKKSRPGGTLKRFKRNSISFDVGFHATSSLGKGEILSSLWDYCGVMSDLDVIPYPEQSCDLFEFDDYDRHVRNYFSYPRFQDELLQHFPEEKSAITAYFKKIQEIGEKVPFYNTALPLTPFLHSAPAPFSSLAGYLAEITSNPILQAVLAAPIYLYGVPSEMASLEIHAQVVHGYCKGAYIVDGGGQAVVDSFVKVLTGLGVEILTSQTVTDIRTDNGRVAGVSVASGDTMRCTDVIYTGHPADMIPMISEKLFRPAYRNRLAGLKNSTSFFMLFGSIESPPEPDLLDWTNLYKFRSGLNILPSSPILPFKERGMMLNCPGRRDKKDLATNKNGVILFEPAYWQDVEMFRESEMNSRPPAYKDFKEKLTEEMLETAQKNWGHICGNIKPLAVGTPLTFRDELSLPEGSAYGALHSIDQSTPSVRTRVPGLWLSGQSTLMTGVMSSSLAGMVTAGEMIGLEPLWEEVRKC